MEVILSITALLLSGIGIGMSIWALAFALKWLAWDESKNSSGGSNSAREKR